MTIPTFVGAGAGAERTTTGSFTVSKTGCTAGNLIVCHMHVLGLTGDWGGWTNAVNIEALDGTASSLTSLRGGGEFQLQVGRVTANGTCSADVAVGASGEDMAARLYEFSGEATGTALADVFENGAGTTDTSSGTGTSITDPITVTNGSDRLAVAFMALESAQAIGDFGGETGGDWTEAVAEYIGTTLTLQLQTASMASAGTIDGGSYTVGVSTTYLGIGTAIIPAPTSRTYKRLYGPAQLAASAADLYTCPASTVARILGIHASNPSGSPVDINLSIGTDAAGTRVYDDFEIPADSVETNFDPYEMAAGEKIQGWASTAGTVVVTVSGYEDPV